MSNNWEDLLAQSTAEKAKSDKSSKKSSALLWAGTQGAVSDWDAAEDPAAEDLRATVLSALGAGRKGDASKIVTVALAVENNGLDLGKFKNLSQAYNEAIRLTKTVKTHADEDAAAEAAVTSIADSAPKSTSKPEGAALLVLSKGTDEAARLLLDALGADNTPAHRALLRSISQEIAGRNKPAPKPKKVAPKPKKATVKKAAAPKAKAGATKAKPVRKPKPVAEAEIEAANENIDDLLDALDNLDAEFIDAENIETPEVEEAPVTRARPVKKAAVKRPVRR